MGTLRKSLAAELAAAVLLLAESLPPASACSGDCAAELGVDGKAVERYAKKYWSGITSCAKRGTPSCPQACPVPDGTGDPYNLSAACAGLVACEMDDLAVSVFAATWDAADFCPAQAATECGVSRAPGRPAGSW